MNKRISTLLFLLIFMLALAACSGQEVADEQVAATPDTAVSTDTTDADAPADENTGPTNSDDLPALPALSSGGGAGYGMGGGGGGGAALESSVAVSEPMPVDDDRMMPYYIENRLENAIFNLNTELPGMPGATTVWQQSNEEMSQEQMQELAARFGFTGPMYTDPWYDQMLAENPGMWPGPRAYYFFDGARTLNLYGAYISYYDGNIAPTDPNWTLLSVEEARPVAEAYLNERGLLDFPYEVIASPYGGQEVAFHRLVNGIATIYPEITVLVVPGNQVLSVYIQPFSTFTAVADYPIISAEEAWALAQTTPDYQRVMQNVFTDPATYQIEPFVDNGDYRYWPRTYQNGEEITLFFYPVVYTAVDGSTPLVRANEFVVNATPADLQLIADSLNQNIRITGTVLGDVQNAQSIRVTSVEVLSGYEEWQSREGNIRLADGQVYLDTIEGESIVIPNAPADLPDGERVYVNGPAIENGVFLWTGIDKYVEYTDEPISIDPVDFPTPAPIAEVNIDSVELIYSPSYTFPEDGNGPGITYMQLAWRFNGRTDTNEIVEIIVQAVSPEYLQTN